MNLLPIQQFALNKKKQLVIALGVIIGGSWLIVMGVMLLDMKQTPAVSRHVAVCSASPALGRAQSATNVTPHFRSTTLKHHAPTINIQKPSVMPAAGGVAMRLHQTSSATMKSVGGGGGNGIATTGNSSSRKGISYGGNMVTISSSLALAAPGAGKANDIAQVVAEPQAKPAVRKVDGPPQIPFPDPVGDVAWGLMIILALAYAGTLYYRRQRTA